MVLLKVAGTCEIPSGTVRRTRRRRGAGAAPAAPAAAPGAPPAAARDFAPPEGAWLRLAFCAGALQFVLSPVPLDSLFWSAIRLAFSPALRPIFQADKFLDNFHDKIPVAKFYSPN